MAAKIICHAAPTIVFHSPLYFEYTAPAHQQILPATTTSKEIICNVFPAWGKTEKVLLLNRSITPINPVITPMSMGIFLKLAFRLRVSNNTNQSGADETKTATRELGKVNSAQIIDPLPMNNNRLPTINEVFN
mgnify:CR=1 FL=1